LDFAAIRPDPKFSRAIQTLIHKESGIAYEPSKSDLGYKLAQCTNENEIPATIVTCLEQAYKLSNL